MSEFNPNQGMSFDDIAKEPSSYWYKARRIIKSYAKYLTEGEGQGLPLLTTPPVTHEVRGTSRRFQLAVLMDGKKMMDTQFLIIDDKFDTPIEITKDGYRPLVRYPTNDAVNEKIDDILVAIDDALRQRSDAEKQRAEQARKQAIEKAQKAWADRKLRLQRFWWRNQGNILGCLCVMLVLAFIIGFFGSLIYWGISDSKKYTQEVAAFDQAHPGMVIKGQRFDFNTSGTLQTIGGPDMEIGVPYQPSQSIDEYPRLYDVQNGSCSIIDRSDAFGSIEANEYLLVESNAPKGVIKVEIDAIGKVTVCATDPTDSGDTYKQWDVLMQTQKVA